jgi:TolB protein
MRQATELPGAEGEPHISPDGRQIVFSSRAAGQWDIYVLRVGGSRAINLTADSSADDRQPAFSPDGQQIAFRSERGGAGIFVMGATGESVRRVTAAGYDPAWSPDGRSLAYSTEPVGDPYNRATTLAEIWVAEVTTGKTRRITTTDGVQPAWSLDGRHIAYWTNKAGQRDIAVVSAEGGTSSDVTNDIATDWSPEWSPDSRWLYFSSDRGGQMNLWRVPMDEQRKPAGPPQPITRSLTGVGHARLSADGTKLSLLSYTRSNELSIVPFDAVRGADVAAISTIRSPSLGWCQPSPHVDWLACTSRGRQEDIVLLRADGAETARLTDDLAKDRVPTWSPDGARVGFMSARSGRWELWTIGRDGSDLRQATDLKAEVRELVWSPDSRRAITTNPSTPFGIWLFDTSSLANRQTATFIPQQSSPEQFRAEAWSANGQLVAGAFLEPSGLPKAIGVWNLETRTTRRFEVPLAGSGIRQIAGWMPDSRRLLAITAIGLVLVDVESGATTPLNVPKGGTAYRLSQDATRLMIERETVDGDVWLLDIGGK